MTYEYREVKPPRDYKPLQLIDEDERRRYFEQSAQTQNGRGPDYRDVKAA